ncbi:hypothetical protein ACVNP0_04650 [Staphylococcus aureus]
MIQPSSSTPLSLLEVAKISKRYYLKVLSIY